MPDLLLYSVRDDRPSGRPRRRSHPYPTLGQGHDAVVGFVIGVPIVELMTFTYPRAASKLRALYLKDEEGIKSQSSLWNPTQIAGLPLAGGGVVSLGNANSIPQESGNCLRRSSRSQFLRVVLILLSILSEATQAS